MPHNTYVEIDENDVSYLYEDSTDFDLDSFGDNDI